MAKKRLLVVDDEAEICELIRRVSEPLGYDVAIAADARNLMAMYRASKPDLIILDIVMPYMDGIEILRTLGEAKCAARILLVSGSSDIYMTSAAKLAEGYGFADVATMRKPLRIAELRRFLSSMSERPPP
ncbi:MAG TPA: response regulator [Alphaproteobacteria bacterium]|nr:response regulator [Alphaproteobacteria bacterium]